MILNEKQALYGNDIEFVLLKIDELRNNGDLTHQDYLNKLNAIVYTYVPRPCLYKGDTLETVLMINNNIGDLKIIKNCLL